MIHEQTKMKRPSLVLTAVLAMVFALVFAASASAVTDTTPPLILSVSPDDSMKDASVYQQVAVEFNEPMDPSTINENTFLVVQSTSPASGSRSLAVDGVVQYANRLATFTPHARLPPNQEYGNVFTATITSGARDLAGNALSQDYVWSFTTGPNAYNAGAFPSQTTQEAMSNPPPASTTSTTTAPVAPSSRDDSIVPTSTFPWLWVILGVVLLALVLGLVAMFLSTSRDKRRVKSTAVASKRRIVTRPNPFGDVYPVEDLEGIGPSYGKALRAMGITDTRQLWHADAKTVAHTIGAPMISVRRWQHMAELASVNSIGPQYAELLERSGVHTIEQLRHAKPRALLARVQKKEASLDVNIQGNILGASTVAHWIDSAREHHYAGETREGQTA